MCLLIIASTITDYCCGIMAEDGNPLKKKISIWISLFVNLSLLGFYKYFNFFVDNVYSVVESLGLTLSKPSLQIFLPIGISFYTFQTMSYTIDIYRGELRAHRNPLNFAVYVAFFPQLVAGPIERATRLLPQIEKARSWNYRYLSEGLSLVVRGLFFKMCIADNLAPLVDKIFALNRPSLLLAFAATIAFSMQIYCDFMGYTEIARGLARLLGIKLMSNFNSPYLARSPSDFWKRWHISFSSWIRDYVYIPMGGSKSHSLWSNNLTLLGAMLISGLWHGPTWNFVFWGFYHGLLLCGYRSWGLGGRWSPQGGYKTVMAITCMYILSLLGWIFFRGNDLTWCFRVLLQNPLDIGLDQAYFGISVVCQTMLWSMPLFFIKWRKKIFPFSSLVVDPILTALLLVLIFLFANEQKQDFIYFQF